MDKKEQAWAGKVRLVKAKRLFQALRLLVNWKNRSHNELDVLAQFLIKVRGVKKIALLDKILLEVAKRELYLATTEKVKPHQLALAYMTMSEATYVLNMYSDQEIHRKIIMGGIKKALELEVEIRQEEDKEQGLRQFVRILKKAGVLYSKPMIQNYEKAFYFLRRAWDMAEGEANTVDQSKKIEEIIQKLTEQIRGNI